MKYFTPDLYVRMQASDDLTADAMDTAWEQATSRYCARLERIRSRLPRAAQRCLQDVRLHDAEVLALAREDGRFVIVLGLEPPDFRTAILTYSLVGEPAIEKNVLPSTLRSRQPRWLYDEWDASVGRARQYRHRVLLSNGWQLELRFRGLRLVVGDRLLELNRSGTGAAVA